MNAATHEHRAKAFECLSLAEWMNNPGNNETLRFARTWIGLAEPIEEAVWAMRRLGVLMMPSRDLPEP